MDSNPEQSLHWQVSVGDTALSCLQRSSKQTTRQSRVSRERVLPYPGARAEQRGHRHPRAMQLLHTSLMPGPHGFCLEPSQSWIRTPTLQAQRPPIVYSQALGGSSLPSNSRDLHLLSRSPEHSSSLKQSFCCHKPMKRV